MAHTGRFVPLDYQGDPSHQQQSFGNSAFRVVDQPPCRNVFPLRLQMNWILAFSIGKCIIGTLLFISGLVAVVIVTYETKIAFPVWCGLTIMANGIVGCVLKCKKTKCLIAAFLGLSITSLIFSITMLSFYSVVLDHFVNWYRTSCYNAGYSCHTIYSSSIKDTGIGVMSFLIALLVFELACSIGSVVVSCKAYSKCCNTCSANDCCAFVGCGECDCRPLNVQQAIQRPTPSYSTSQNIQISSVQPPAYELQQQPAYQLNQQPAYQLNQQPSYQLNQQPAYQLNQQPAYQLNQQRVQNNPCSGFVSFVINIPSYVFGAANGSQLSAINVNVRPFASDQQAPLIEQNRDTEQVQGATSVATGGNQPYQTSATWEKLDT